MQSEFNRFAIALIEHKHEKRLHSHASVIMRATNADVPFIYQRPENITSLKPARSWGAVYSHWNFQGIQPNIFCTHRNQFAEILVSSISYWASNSCMYSYFEKQLICGFWVRLCDFLRLAIFMLRFFWTGLLDQSYKWA